MRKSSRIIPISLRVVCLLEPTLLAPFRIWQHRRAGMNPHSVSGSLRLSNGGNDLLAVISRKGCSTMLRCWQLMLGQSCRLVAAGSNLTATLPLLSAYLLDAAANYSDTRPCMVALLARLQHINATVIVLPASLAVSDSCHAAVSLDALLMPLYVNLHAKARVAWVDRASSIIVVLPCPGLMKFLFALQSAATELQSVEATLDAVLYNGTTNATALAAEIDAATQNINVAPFPASTLTALNNSQVDSATQKMSLSP